MRTSNKACDVENELKKVGTKQRAETSAWFFKTDEGQYGYGDKFLGVAVGEQRKISKRYKDLPLREVNNLLYSEYHECRLTGLFILVLQYQVADKDQQDKIVKFYLSNLKRVNNWDLVDASARYILGEFLQTRQRTKLYKLVKSKNLWERRIAIVSTHAFILNGDFNDTLEISTLLLDDKEDLIHKAVGWMLREVGKQDKGTLVNYLDRHANRMPRTALRYSIEHFNEKDRKKYLAIKKIN